MAKQKNLLLVEEYSGRKTNNRFFDQRFAHMKTVDIIKWHDFNSIPPAMVKYYQRRIPNLVSLMTIRKPHGLAFAKYIIFVYDKQSPFVVEHRLLPERKKAVLAFIGLNEANKQEQANTCLELSDEILVDALSDYLKWQDDYTWNMIVQNEEVFYNNQRQIIQGVSAINKDTDRLKASEYQSKLLDFNEKIQKRIKSLWAEFTGVDPEAEAKIKERKPVTPEIIAEWDFVGADYNFGIEDDPTGEEE